MRHTPLHASDRPRPLELALRLIAAAALAVDAYVHADLAPRFDANTATISQGDLFRIEAGLAAFAALLVLFVRNRLAPAFALLVAAGGLAAVLIYHYSDPGKLGPLPNMYEPVWYTQKTISAVSQIVATLACGALLARRQSRTPAPM
ncbi:hypothetical protein [Streptomyces sp. H27-C3]|uniref:hypothetical protein n=1 Tax=Streptomyces sp. H27-C3 TaxID=3046305 RepID=UPI0024BA6705|nr:hypothetical protein [Streptomyces sp. H27-C3]MDJ0463835.1 hypothetical protein [Streptomyces sp. H27-C3]